MILRRGPLTAEIALLSVVLSWVVGIPVAIVSALQAQHRGRQRRPAPLHPVPRGASGFWIGVLIVLGLLFWSGYARR